jgi:uncharacterized protein (DUF849 family)
MAAPQSKVIVTCAVTGSIHTPTMSPYLPITAREIEDEAVAAAEAGAAIVHLHARNPENGQPSQDPALFRAFLPRIAARSDVVINLTTGGAPNMSVEERLQPALQLKPEVASLNMGSMNFGLYPMLARHATFKHDWERPYLEGSEDRVFRNTFKEIRYILESCADNGTRFEIECYDTSHLYTAAHFIDRGILKPPFFIQSVFGLLGGIGTHADDVMHMRRTAGACSARTTTGPCSAPVAARCRLHRWRRRWAETSALAWRIHSGRTAASCPPATPSRSNAWLAF